MARPNIVFLFSDEHRPDAMGCSGGVARTPHLDALAAEGARFGNMYCQAPLCQPARASIITGRYVRDHGVAWNFGDMDPSWPTMMKSLQAAGYATALVGKTHFYSKPPIDQLDLRDNASWVREFGFDYALEEFDAPHNPPPQFSDVWPAPFREAPEARTPYKQYLLDRGLWDTYWAEVHSLLSDRARRNDGLASAIPSEHSQADFTASRAIDWIRSYEGDAPFFLSLSFVQPHPPFISSREWYETYRGEEMPPGPTSPPKAAEGSAWARYLQGLRMAGWLTEFNRERSDETARHYCAIVSQMDGAIGRVVAEVQRRGWGDNTWFVYSSDHGEMLGDHGLWNKLVFYRPSVVVPAIIRPPEGMPAKTVDALAESIDLTATILDIAGAAAPEGMSGRSLLPQMRGEGTPRDVVFSELGGLMGRGGHFVMAATERYRYVWERDSGSPCELFDLRDDPGENVNLIGDPAHEGVANDMLKDYVRPFVEGRIG